ncbi:MAG: hypothetical protein ACFB12_25895 [Leptolyngbyaceae cyanobacterium]
MRSRQFGQPSQPAVGKWFLISLLIVLVVGVIFFAVSLPPASGQSGTADTELLTKQIDFILKMNSAFLAFLGIVGALLTWFFKNNLEDAKKIAGDIVRRELDERIKALVQDEFDDWERTVQPERLVSKTRLNYFLPDDTRERQDISEVRLLELRGFRKPISFCTTKEGLSSLHGYVTILDLQNWQTSSGLFTELSDNQQEVKSAEMVHDLLNNILPETAVLVVYFRGHIKNLNRIEPSSENQYLLIANNPVTLVGHAANGAYVAYSDRATGR